MEKLDWKRSVRIATREAHEERASLAATIECVIQNWERLDERESKRGPRCVVVEVVIFTYQDVESDYAEALIDETREQIIGSGAVLSEGKLDSEHWRFEAEFEDWNDEAPASYVAAEALNEIQCLVPDVRWKVLSPEGHSVG